MTIYNSIKQGAKNFVYGALVVTAYAAAITPFIIAKYKAMSCFTLMLIRQKSIQLLHDYCLEKLKIINQDINRSALWSLWITKINSSVAPQQGQHRVVHGMRSVRRRGGRFDRFVGH